MKKLENLIQELENEICKHEKLNTAVSSVSVGWHIEHCFLAINMITNALQHPRVEYKWTFNLKKILVLDIFNFFPRGKAKAPKTVQPQNKITVDSIKLQLEMARKSIKILDSLPLDLFLEHPYFGHLKVNQTKKFLTTHTKHHLLIIKDILK
jgi:hypothetical protein